MYLAASELKRMRIVFGWPYGMSPQSIQGLTPPGSRCWFVIGESILSLQAVSLSCVARFNSDACARRIVSVDQIDFSAVDVAVDVDVHIGGAWW